MKNIKELLEEANESFNGQLKIKPGVYDEPDRKDYVFGYVTASYQELFEELNRIKKLALKQKRGFGGKQKQ